MNIHPLLVHFPIALLLSYSLLELIRFKRFHGREYWFFAKAILVILGTLGAFAAFVTGDGAEHAYGGPLSHANARIIINLHSTFAGLATAFYGVIAVFYIIGWLRREHRVVFHEINFLSKLWNLLVTIETSITEGALGVILAIIAALLLSLVGGLGGLIAYGPNNDPVTTWLYGLIIR